MTGLTSLHLNGESVEVGDVEEDELLLTTLRDRLGRTSVRYCCGIGVCGTCTVLLDGSPVSACLLLTSMCHGRRVETAERLADSADELEARVLKAFEDQQAFQCSYCIPAFVITVTSLLRSSPGASVAELREQLGGNLCRCGSYPQIERALIQIVDGATAKEENR